MAGIEELKKAEGSRFQVKQMERTKKSLEARLDKLEKTHDDILTFEEMGIDKLIVDESHEFKNVPTQTNVHVDYGHFLVYFYSNALCLLTRASSSNL